MEEIGWKLFVSSARKKSGRRPLFLTTERPILFVIGA
jgi:hypothetical protein